VFLSKRDRYIGNGTCVARNVSIATAQRMTTLSSNDALVATSHTRARVTWSTSRTRSRSVSL